MPKLNALVAGSTGYIGTQLIKILVKHKYIKIKYLCGNSSVGKSISFYEKSLSKYKLPKIRKFNKNLLDLSVWSKNETFFPTEVFPHKYFIFTL